MLAEGVSPLTVAKMMGARLGGDGADGLRACAGGAGRGGDGEGGRAIRTGQGGVTWRLLPPAVTPRQILTCVRRYAA